MKIQEISPILWTTNLDETIKFYTEALGFTAQSNFPHFVSLSKDDTRLMFVVPQEEPDFHQSVLTGSIYIFMENVDAFWELVKDKATIKDPIADRAYLMRDFAILDNNGYELVFGEDISGRPK
ncbi:MAG: VOC family protein [Chitinophagaceae bacterium]|nr:VOC family protein [Chitinophagaceae bacterium]